VAENLHEIGSELLHQGKKFVTNAKKHFGLNRSYRLGGGTTVTSENIRRGFLSCFIVASSAFALATATGQAADLNAGQRLYRSKDYQGAEKVLREVVTAEPDNLEANYYLGMTLLELEKYSESEPFLQKAADGKPEARAGLGRAFMMQDKFDEATSQLDAAQKDLPDSSAVYQYRGMILLKQEKYGEAEEQLVKAVELDPKNAYAHYYLGMTDSRLKKTDRMVKEFQLFLQLAPKAPEAAKVKSLLRSL
jgi:tetratricopeptide (TPR) repeat protein